MFNISDFLSNLETTQHLLDRCYDFRGAVLLTPDEMALAARQRDMALPAGWGIRTVLSAEEVSVARRLWLNTTSSFLASNSL